MMSVLKAGMAVFRVPHKGSITGTPSISAKMSIRRAIDLAPQRLG